MNSTLPEHQSPSPVFVSPSSIYGVWLFLWYYQTLLSTKYLNLFYNVIKCGFLFCIVLSLTSNLSRNRRTTDYHMSFFPSISNVIVFFYFIKTEALYRSCVFNNISVISWQSILLVEEIVSSSNKIKTCRQPLVVTGNDSIGKYTFIYYPISCPTVPT
jgi:quinol-cytochrome oxidoreductase complex cytochrome b subunit